MPKPWELLGFIDRVAVIVQSFPLLSDEQIKKVTDEWAGGEYEDSFHGEQEAIADLMKALRYESMSVEQREQEKQRIAKSVEDYISWQGFKP